MTGWEDFLLGGYDVNFFLAAIPFQLILILYYARRWQMPVRESQVFLVLMVFNLATMVTDLISLSVGEAWQVYGTAAFYAVNMIFFFCMDFLGYSFFFYVGETLHLFTRKREKLRYLSMVPAVLYLVAVLSSPWTRFVFYLDPANGYVSGPGYDLLYQVFGFYLILAFLVTLKSSPKETHERRYSMTAMTVVLFLFLMLRSAVNHAIIFSYGATLVITLIYFLSRNPDLYRDGQTGLLSIRGYEKVLEDWVGRETLRGFGFRIREYEEMRVIYGEDVMDQVLLEIGRFISLHYRNAAHFYLKDGQFFLLTRRGGRTEEAVEKLKRRFERGWGDGKRSFFFDVACFTLEDSVHFRSPEQFAQVVHSALLSLQQPGTEDIVVDEEFLKKVKREVHIWQLLDDSLAHDSLAVFLQPLVKAETGKPEGAEALVRLIDKDGTVIGPCEFIPAAEANGSVVTLGIQVFGKVCRFIREGNLAACGLTRINVNVSPLQCLNMDFPAQLEKVRKSYGVSVSAICLEITEQSSLSKAGTAVVAELSRLGYTLSLDDYGSGYSNAGRMKDLPFQELKLDMGLVRDYFRHPDSYLPDLIATIRGLGLRVVAEGVETKDMADALGKMGVDVFQGYYYSKPVSMERFMEKYGKAAKSE